MDNKSKDNYDADSVKKVFTHKGRYVQYSLYGNLFEVSTKYVPPLRPIGRGAYGIVWLVSFIYRLIKLFIRTGLDQKYKHGILFLFSFQCCG